GLYSRAPALAPHHAGGFQLDGDASSSTDPITPPATDDWNNVCHQVNATACPTGPSTAGATAVSWTAEPDRSASIFTGGGSKDPQDISNWAWKDAGGLPDKDNLLHAFAARYSVTGAGGTTDCPTGTTCDALYFGSDRLDNS